MKEHEGRPSSSSGQRKQSEAVSGYSPEHDAATNALRESEARFRTLFESAGDGIFIADSTGRYVDVNARGALLMGYSRQEVLQRSIVDIVIESQRSRVPEEVAAVLTGRPHLSEWRFVRKDGSTFPGEVNAQLLPDGRVMGIVRDITERRQAEDALRASQSLLRTVMDGTPDPIFVKDRQGRLLLANPAVLRAFGRPLEEVLGKTDVEIYSDLAVGQTVMETDRRIMESGHTEVVEERIQTPQGYRVFLSTKSPEYDAQGNVIGVIGIARDITDRNQAQEALQRSEERFRLALEASHAMVYDLDVRTLQVNAVRGLAELLGREEGEAQYTFQWWENQIHPDELDLYQTAFRGILAQPRETTLEYRVRHKEGRWLFVEDHAKPVCDESGKVRRIAGTVVDVTVRKEDQNTLLRWKKELEQRVKDRTAELSQMVEKLQDEIVRRRLAEDVLRKRGEQLRQVASELTVAEQQERGRLAELLHDGLQQILVAAKLRLVELMQARDPSIQKAANKVDELIGESIRASRDLTAELNPGILHEEGLLAAMEWLGQWMSDRHDLTVAMNVQGHIGQMPEATRILLFQSVRELLFNVVKHAQVRAARVDIRQADDEIQITVADEGAGFDPDRLSGRREVSGGFGLFSIRDRLDLLGGRMEIHSAPGRGSRFTLVAPLSVKPEGSA